MSRRSDAASKRPTSRPTAGQPDGKRTSLKALELSFSGLCTVLYTNVYSCVQKNCEAARAKNKDRLQVFFHPKPLHARLVVTAELSQQRQIKGLVAKVNKSRFLEGTERCSPTDRHTAPRSSLCAHERNPLAPAPCARRNPSSKALLVTEFYVP